MTTSDKFINKCNNNLALTHSLTHSPTYSLTCLLAYLRLLANGFFFAIPCLLKCMVFLALSPPLCCCSCNS